MKVCTTLVHTISDRPRTAERGSEWHMQCGSFSVVGTRDTRYRLAHHTSDFADAARRATKIHPPRHFDMIYNAQHSGCACVEPPAS